MTTTFDPLTIFVITWGSIILTIFAILYILIIRCLNQERPHPHHLTPHTMHLITLNTRIGCSDGYCYLRMFRPRHYNTLRSFLGAFPTIGTLLAVPPIYRSDQRGTLIFFGNTLIHYKPDPHGAVVWGMLEYALLNIDIIARRQITRISSNPPRGFSYLKLFKLEWRTHIGGLLGLNPLIWLVLGLDMSYRLDVGGVIWEVEEGVWGFVHMEGYGNGWEQLRLIAERSPEDRIGM